MSMIIGHKGACAYAPENTLESFKLALDMGADAIELDVHLSKDGEIVVIHDEKVKRTTEAEGFVYEMTLAELKELDACYRKEAYRGVKIPTLGEVYDLVRDTDCIVHVEIKTDKRLYPDIEKKCLALEKEKGMKGRVIYSSFNHYTLKTLKELDPEAKTALLYESIDYQPWNYAKMAGADYIHPCKNSLYLAKDVILQSVENGIPANVWTVNTEDIMEECIRQKAGIITDYPDVAVTVRKRLL